MMRRLHSGTLSGQSVRLTMRMYSCLVRLVGSQASACQARHSFNSTSKWSENLHRIAVDNMTAAHAHTLSALSLAQVERSQWRDLKPTAITAPLVNVAGQTLRASLQVGKSLGGGRHRTHSQDTSRLSHDRRSQAHSPELDPSPRKSRRR